LIRAIDLFPPEDIDDEDVRVIPDIMQFAHLNGIHCITALVVQLENNGLVEWSATVKRTAGVWLAFFEKWTRDCDGCEHTNGEFLSGLDWSV